MTNKNQEQLVFNGSSSRIAQLIIVLYTILIVVVIIICSLFISNYIMLGVEIGILVVQYPFTMRFIVQSFYSYKNERLKIHKT
jgi:membrane protein YdbS with pleckstrin-like domain